MHDLPLITTIAAAFTAAWVLGIITQKLRLSPIVGYLLAGIAIGPHTPGFAGDVHLAQQLAEVGVILLMFGVGLHFNLKDLLAVRKVALPGAVGQIIVATLLGMVAALGFGWPVKSGVVLGVAMAVASTVVLLRVLMDHRLLDTPHGHVAVGWLIVEDIFTVVVLVLIPVLGHSGAADPTHAAAAAHGPFVSILIALAKLAALVAILLLAGSKLIPWIMVRVAGLRSRELFTLTVLVMAVAIAAASQTFFGASMALGAFLAGMVVGQSPVANQAAADALPLRDAFAVLFFCSVGMLFDPRFLLDHPLMVLIGLTIIMIGKPLAALVIVALIGYPARTGITVALGLAQIGEFSFILSESARANGLLGDEGHNILVACAIASITLNPILFLNIGRIERWLVSIPPVWRFLDRGARHRQDTINAATGEMLGGAESPVAIIVGYGPVGRTVDELIRDGGLETVIVDLNMSTVLSLQRRGRAALFGDAFNIEVMHAAMERATHLIITLPHSTNRSSLIAAAKLINPDIKVFVRARYIAERDELLQLGADGACFEEAEAAVALSRLVLEARGSTPEQVRRETQRIRRHFRTSI